MRHGTKKQTKLMMQKAKSRGDAYRALGIARVQMTYHFNKPATGTPGKKSTSKVKGRR